MFITKYLIILFISSTIFAQNNSKDFMSKYEYGKLLYKKPRGISCAKCHGNDAKGRQIVKFKHIRNKKEYICTVKSPDITNIDFETFKAVLDPNIEKPKKKFKKNQVCKKLIYGNIMPTYFLTPQEIESIYEYLVKKRLYNE